MEERYGRCSWLANPAPLCPLLPSPHITELGRVKPYFLDLSYNQQWPGDALLVKETGAEVHCESVKIVFAVLVNKR